MATTRCMNCKRWLEGATEVNAGLCEACIVTLSGNATIDEFPPAAPPSPELEGQNE